MSYSEDKKSKNQQPTKAEGSKTAALFDEDSTAKNKAQVKEVMASARYLRIGPRKMRLVIDAVRGMNCLAAIDKLKFINKKASKFAIKLLNSALANAENNFHLNKEKLLIVKIIANEGPMFHRFMPRAHGRAAAIRKRTTHLHVILAEQSAQPKKSVNLAHDKTVLKKSGRRSSAVKTKVNKVKIEKSKKNQKESLV